MKRQILLPVILFSLLSLSAFADNILLLTNPKTKETNVFRTGSYIVYQLKADNSMHEGFIRNITDSSLVLDYAQVSLSQINIFAGSTKAKLVARRVVNEVGSSLLYAGMSVFDCGTNLIFYNDYYYWPVGGTIWVAGAVIAGLGYAFDWALSSPQHSVRVRNYKQWNASIVTDGQTQSTEKQNIQTADSTKIKPAPVAPPKEQQKKTNNTEDDVYGD